MILIVAEWLQRHRQHVLEFSEQPVPRLIRWSIYYGVVLAMALFGGQPQEFIYFQF
jgi:hypothetical protein